MKKRLTFKCWKCKREYSLLRELTGLPKIVVECPYCETEAVVDLAPDRESSVEVMRDIEGSAGWTTLNLPDVIPTKPLTVTEP